MNRAMSLLLATGDLHEVSQFAVYFLRVCHGLRKFGAQDLAISLPHAMCRHPEVDALIPSWGGQVVRKGLHPLRLKGAPGDTRKDGDDRRSHNPSAVA